MSATTDKKIDFWKTLTGNKLLLTLTVTYVITGITLYYFDLLPWSHHDSDNEDITPEAAIKEKEEEDDTGTRTQYVKNLLYKNSVFVYMILGWLGFFSLALAWISRIVIGSPDSDGKSKRIIDILPNGYFRTIFSIMLFIIIILGLVAMTFYFISYTPLTLSIILDIVNFMIIGGGMAVIFEASKKSTSALLGSAFGLLLGGLMIGWIGALIAMVIGGVIGYVLGVGGGGEVKTDPRKAFLKAVLSYIPCLFVSIVDYVKREFNMTTRKVWLLLILELVIIGLRMLLPILYAAFNRLITPKGNILIKDAVYLNNQTSLGMFLSAQQIKDGNFHERQIINYNYALSFWLWINPQPGSTSPAYNRPTSLLDFGDILKIKFNRNKIEIYAATSKKNVRPEELVRVYEWKKLEYQRWNNFVINYSGGTLDIFINNVLVSSTPNITPIKQFEKATAGSVNGIYGGIKDVIYYEHTLSRRQINIVSKD